jgi:hypothetical protein
VFRVTGGTPREDDDPPRISRSTIADVTADLDVIDLPVLAASWARSAQEDGRAGTPPDRDRGRFGDVGGEYSALLASDRG